MTKRKIEYRVIPPKQDGAFVACREEVLETSAQAYAPQQPVLCMDEQPVQLLKETRVPIPPTQQQGERVDYQYERNGTASIFMFAEPLSGFRLHVAECAWSCLTSQCLRGRRIGELTELQSESAAWSDRTNAKQRSVDWQFRIENAGTKRKRLYPTIKT